MARHISICHGAPHATRTRTRETARTRARSHARRCSPAIYLHYSKSLVGNGPLQSQKTAPLPITGPPGLRYGTKPAYPLYGSRRRHIPFMGVDTPRSPLWDHAVGISPLWESALRPDMYLNEVEPVLVNV